MKKLRDSRSLLRAAITSRKAAHQHREEAAGALDEAEVIFASSMTDRDLARSRLIRAEEAKSEAMASMIRAGEKPDLATTPEITAAQADHADAESRCRMAKAARDQLADDLKLAESELIDAGAAVLDAATRVVTSEVEDCCNLERINRAVGALIEIDEMVFGLGYLWSGGAPLHASRELKAIFARLEPLRNAVAMMRPDRPMLSPPIEQTTMQRFDAYRKALTDNPDTKLEDIPVPQWQPPAPPPSINMVEDGRVRSAQAWARATSGGKIASVG